VADCSARDFQRITPRRCLRLPGGSLRTAHWGVGTPEMSRGSKYNTGVSGGFPQAGKNVALSRALLSVGTLIRARGRPNARPAPFLTASGASPGR
jgi:hypothetical protein